MSRFSPTLTHDWIWHAIEALAGRHRLSPSALARLAGLDPTAFNRSKRFTPEGRPRWPSTESIAKVLEATRTSLEEFVEMQMTLAERPAAETAIPPDTHVPIVGEVRDAAISNLVLLPRMRARRPQNLDVRQSRFAIAVGDGSLEPVYCQGNTLILSTAEEAHPGDRVVVKPAGRMAIPRILLRASDTRIELGPFRAESHRLRLERDAIEWIARIVWVRQ